MIYLNVLDLKESIVKVIMFFYKLNFIWFDLEMIGFELVIDKIFEIVIVVIDSDLNILVEGFVIVIY